MFNCCDSSAEETTSVGAAEPVPAMKPGEDGSMHDASKKMEPAAASVRMNFTETRNLMILMVVSVSRFLFLAAGRQAWQDNLSVREPADTDEVINPPKGSIEVGVFRFAGFALAMVDVDFSNFQARLGKNCR